MSLPRPHTNPYAAVSEPYSPGGVRRGSGGSAGGIRMPRIFKRLFKFPQMDFEVAVWEMTGLMFTPKKVWKNVYYRPDHFNATETKNTYSTTDPAFPYLLSFFMFLTSLAWSLAYANASFPNVLRIACVFVFIHCLLWSLFVATFMYFAIERLFGAGGVLFGRTGRRRGLFGVDQGGQGAEPLEFGFCFDVAIRAFFPIWVFLYVIQFILLPAVTTHRWPSTLLSNTLHLIAWAHSSYITFLGYNSLPTLSSTHVIVAAPLAVCLVSWLIASLTGFNASLHFAPILWAGGTLRKNMG